MTLERLQHNERSKSIGALSKGRASFFNSGGKMAELKTTIGDYRDVEILPDSVIYCDIPYNQCRGYGNDESFDHEAFYDWCEKQTELVLISEYWCPPERFVCIAEFPRTSTFSATNNSKKEIEKVFVPKHQYEAYKRIMNVQLDLFEDDNPRANRAKHDGSE